MRAVAAGLADATIVNTYYLGLLANSTSAADREVAEKLKLFFPNQNNRGTLVNVSGAGVVKHADNVGVQEILRILASDEAQSIFPSTSAENPAVPSIEWSPMQKSWGEFKADSDIIVSYWRAQCRGCPLLQHSWLEYSTLLAMKFRWRFDPSSEYSHRVYLSHLL